MDSSSLPEPSLRAYLAKNHERLEGLMRLVSARCEAVDADGARGAWDTFLSHATRQMDGEDRVLVPHLGPKNPREARALSSEHRHLRSRMAQVSEAARQGALRLDLVRSLMDELRAHTRHEEEVVHLHIDLGDPPDVQRAVLEALERAIDAKG